jgi:hypothetical protein
MNRPLVLLPQDVFDATWRLLASFAVPRGAEGVVYWFGVESPAYSIVTTLIVPNARSMRGGLHTSAMANAEVLESVVGTPLVLVGQAHSHPAEWVEHSPTDDRQTFAAFEGGISVVVPSFAAGAADFARCGVHRVLDGAFRLLGPPELDGHLRILPSVRDFRKTGLVRRSPRRAT